MTLRRKKYDQYGQDWKHADQFEKAKQTRGGQGFGGEDFGGGNFGGYTYSSGDDSEFSDFFESVIRKAQEPGEAVQNFADRDGENAELHLTLTDVYKTHKQTLTINGKNVRITIPAGVENGQVIRLKGYGSEGANGGPRGDLLITFVINNDTPSRRDGNDLYKTGRY